MTHIYGARKVWSPSTDVWQELLTVQRVQMSVTFHKTEQSSNRKPLLYILLVSLLPPKSLPLSLYLSPSLWQVPQGDIRCLPQSLSTFIDSGSLTKPGAHQRCQQAMDSSVFTLQVLELRYLPPGFIIIIIIIIFIIIIIIGTRNLSSVSHACVARTYQWPPDPNSQYQ